MLALHAWRLGFAFPTVANVDFISVGNPLASWVSGLAENGHVVLDTGICFKTAGSIHGIKAHFSNLGEESWPRFLVLEHMESAQGFSVTWQVVASSSARRASLAGRPTRLKLLAALPVKPGHCLGWHVANGSVSSVAFVETRPYQQRWILPDGKNQGSFSAVAVVGEPLSWTGRTLDFSTVNFRRYALMVELVPSQNSFYHYAMRYQEILRQRWQESSQNIVDDCWFQGGLSPEMCCIPAGTGTDWCFDAVYTYERCCKGIQAPAAWVPSKAALPEVRDQPNFVEPDGTLSARPQLTVDLFIRTFHTKLQELTHLLHSVALFWPADWGVLVVLDGDSAEDEHACALLPSWSRCSLQPKPSFLAKFTKPFSHIDPFGVAGKGLDRHQGLIWKEWSECWADRHSTAKFIAISDSDVVLTTFGIPQLLFQPKSEDSSTVRPVIWAHAENVQFPNTIAALNLQWQAEFMDSFPLVVKRSHFRTLRRRIVSLYGQDLTLNATAFDEHFDESFVRYLVRVRELSEQVGGVECPSFHSMMGSVLWSFHRQEYVWSIRHGHLTGVPLQHTCPRLRVAQHAAYWGRENWLSYAGLPFKHLKVGGRPAVLSEVAYAARSSTLILAGLCALPWMETNTSQHVDYARERQTFTVTSQLRRPDAGLLEVQRDLCSYGLGLAEATSEVEDRLLARAFPAQRWTRAESEHCGNLQVEKLLEAYRQLMHSISFTPPQSPPR